MLLGIRWTRRSDPARPQSSRLAEFGGLGMSFNICRGTLGSLAMFTAIRDASSRDSPPINRLRVRYRSHSCRAHQQPARQLMTHSVILPAAIDAVRNVHSPPHTWRARRRGPLSASRRMECGVRQCGAGSGRLRYWPRVPTEGRTRKTENCACSHILLRLAVVSKQCAGWSVP